MTNDVKVAFRVQSRAQIAVGHNNALCVIERAGDDMTTWRDDARAPTTEDVHIIGQSQGKVGREWAGRQRVGASTWAGLGVDRRDVRRGSPG